MPERPESAMTVTTGSRPSLRIGGVVIDRPMRFTGMCVNDDGTVDTITFPEVVFFTVGHTPADRLVLSFEITETPYMVQRCARREGSPIYDQLMEGSR